MTVGVAGTAAAVSSPPFACSSTLFPRYTVTPTANPTTANSNSKNTHLIHLFEGFCAGGTRGEP
ncbi:hypothetical protein OF846_000344 [Rhodotorula toruloides]|nr:hypothetical protein OF846_000344 [Rhodotorula toruloides]